jgi:hypothetical protein
MTGGWFGRAHVIDRWAFERFDFKVDMTRLRPSGKLFGDNGQSLSPSHAVKDERR